MALSGQQVSGQDSKRIMSPDFALHIYSFIQLFAIIFCKCFLLKLSFESFSTQPGM